MFEKSLVDLIRGLRTYKGSEGEYVRKTLKECRAEVRSQDMDVKATALLKLVYLEMMGHDMSWASFHVLEVMSSPKYHQKRVGYLGAVQSFRPDTEVLMLATNLLKKDLGSPTATVMSLPIATLPHIITSSLALSILPDLLPRMNHSQPGVRKKTLVTLYRLALVYPEALRAAWPKIKERLMDPDEDPSVTSAIVNVVCELGWRRPHDFLPLAPRFFELLVDGNNNWVAIKLIKLFATLTPLEPRLVKKLLPPLTNLIKTTPAMSLLYECINGIIQGGILGNADDTSGTEEIAELCVAKLRSMIMVDGDPNLKYVALLAFNKIIATHSFLVAQQEDVILDCIDSPDITIRIQALDLVQGMVAGDSLVSVVSRLMRQLKSSTSELDRDQFNALEQRPGNDSDDEAQTANTTANATADQAVQLPDHYRVDVMWRILAMGSKDNYANVIDFDWYIDILTQLVRLAPANRADEQASHDTISRSSTGISNRIGNELRNIAVKVRAMRSTVVRACDDILVQVSVETPSSYKINIGALHSVVWILGEYASQLARPQNTLDALLQFLPRTDACDILAATLQSIAKVFAYIAGDEQERWTSDRKAAMSLTTARILSSFEPLTLHPDLEVQGCAVEFSELLKLINEAAAGQPASAEDSGQETPLLLMQALPSLFKGWELNSVAPGAQFSVPTPNGLDLDAPIHPDLNRLLSSADSILFRSEEADDFEQYYHQRPAPMNISSSSVNIPAINRLSEPVEDLASSYQQPSEDSYLDADIVARRKAERMERNKDDPFYIPSGHAQGVVTPIHNILQNTNGQDLDIDSIPIMQLDLSRLETSAPTVKPRPVPRQKVVIDVDETLGTKDGRIYDSENNSDSFTKTKAKKLKQSLLQVDSSNIGSFSLEGKPGDGSYEQQGEDADMSKAIKEVERLRLEMQRANERIQLAQGVDVEGTIVKQKKKKKKKPATAGNGDGDGEIGAEVVKPKRKTKKSKQAEATEVEREAKM